MSAIRLACAIASTLLWSTAAVAAEPWRLTTVLKPPAEAGYVPYESVGFGLAVAMSDDWLAVSAGQGRCETPAGVTRGSVILYRHDPMSDEFVYVQQICDTGTTGAIALWNDWLLVGSPNRDGVPGDDEMSGIVSFHRLDRAQQRWNPVQTSAGHGHGQLGKAVAMQGGVAVAGESSYDAARGHVHSWRLNAAGTLWIAETTLAPGGPLTPRIEPNESFGSSVALDISGCRSSTCVAPLDALLVQSRAGLYSYERLATGWGSRTLVPPARGTTTGPSVAINAGLAVAGANMIYGDPAARCAGGANPDAGGLRILTRQPGSAALRAKGFACPQQLGISPMRSVLARSAFTSRESTEFSFSLPDFPADRIGTVSTWELLGTSQAITPTDFVADLNYTPEYYAVTGSGLYNPSSTGDNFGEGLAVLPRRMAVGATFREGFWGLTGEGYVAIYER